MKDFEPFIVSNFLNEKDFSELVSHFKGRQGLTKQHLDKFGRALLLDTHHPILKKLSEQILPLVRNYFNDDSILPSYSIFAEYSAEKIYLEKHKDQAACTYTVDLVLYQEDPWAIWIEGKEYIANENDAIIFMGEDQEHWRDAINNNKNKIGLVYFHYVKPDHWWYTNPEWRHI